jgi:hypothetical protein
LLRKVSARKLRIVFLAMTNLKSALSTPVSALLLFSLATACGSSDSGKEGGPDASNTGGSTVGGAGGATDAGGAQSDGDATNATGGNGNGGAGTGGVGAATGTGGAAPDTEASTTTPGLPVDLGSAGNYVILAKSGISTVPPSAVTGDLGTSPAAATYVTGFSLTMDATKAFSTSLQVTGKVYASDYASPTGANLTAAVGDMLLAFTDAAGRAPDHTELGAGNVGGMTLEPGVYKWGTSLLIPTDVILKGSATAVWIFQIAQDLTVGNAVHVQLSGGALPQNIFWQVSGLAALGTTAHFEGIVLGKTSITLATGASIDGRLLSQKAVTLDASTVVEPAP